MHHLLRCLPLVACLCCHSEGFQVNYLQFQFVHIVKRTARCMPEPVLLPRGLRSWSFLPTSTPFVVWIGLSHPFRVFSLSLSRCLRLRLVSIAFAVAFQVNQRRFNVHTQFYARVIVVESVTTLSSGQVISAYLSMSPQSPEHRFPFGSSRLLVQAAFACPLLSLRSYAASRSSKSIREDLA